MEVASPKSQVRIALQNSFEQRAEAELAKRMKMALERIGAHAEIVQTSDEILACEPDFVISLFHSIPKLLPIPTYGCIWNPPESIKADTKVIKNLLSYDGYLVSGSAGARILEEFVGDMKPDALRAELYTSCFSTDFQFRSPFSGKLFYAGTNWDGQRHKDLFKELSKRGRLNVYGPKGAWNYIESSYRGEIPFDGNSVLRILNETGAGLVLHKAEHQKAGLPSMRLFETIAAGAVAICQPHPFIVEHFKDAVLFVDSNASNETLADQIENHLKWISLNPDQARRLTEKATSIFEQKFALEKLLGNIIKAHKTRERAAALHATTNSRPLVSVVMRVGGRNTTFIERALRSIANQRITSCQVILARYAPVDGLDQTIEKFKSQLQFKVIECPRTGYRSSTLFQAFAAVDGEHFCILDDDDEWHSEHLKNCLSALAQAKEDVVYTGAIRWWEDQPTKNQNGAPMETRELAYLDSFDRSRLTRLDNYIHSSAFVCRSSLLSKVDLSDCKLVVLEDLYMLLQFCRWTDFLFLPEATTQFSFRQAAGDNSQFLSRRVWWRDARKIERLYEGTEFPGGLRVSRGPFVFLASRFLFRNFRKLSARIMAQIKNFVVEMLRTHPKIDQLIRPLLKLIYRPFKKSRY